MSSKIEVGSILRGQGDLYEKCPLKPFILANTFPLFYSLCHHEVFSIVGLIKWLTLPVVEMAFCLCKDGVYRVGVMVEFDFLSGFEAGSIHVASRWPHTQSSCLCLPRIEITNVWQRKQPHFFSSETGFPGTLSAL